MTFEDALERSVAIHGWMTEEELGWLYHSVAALPQNANIIEIGSYKGRSAYSLLAAGTPTQTFWFVDKFIRHPWSMELSGADVCHLFMTNLEEFKYRLLIMDSVDAAKLFPQNFFDMIFIDADHDDIASDFVAWYPKIKSNGLFCGHDYGYQPITEYLKDYSFSLCASIWCLGKGS